MYRRKQRIPVHIEDNIFNFLLEQRSEVTESQIVNNSQQLEKECGRAVCSHGEDVGMGNDEDEELSEAEGSQSKTESPSKSTSREK